MTVVPINAGIRAYLDSGANEDLARAMVAVYNPLYGNTKLSEREQNACKEIDFRKIGFLYLFKGDEKKGRMYVELANSMCDDITRRNIQKILDKWDEVCTIVNSSRQTVNRLRAKRK